MFHEDFLSVSRLAEAGLPPTPFDKEDMEFGKEAHNIAQKSLGSIPLEKAIEVLTEKGEARIAEVQLFNRKLMIRGRADLVSLKVGYENSKRGYEFNIWITVYELKYGGLEESAFLERALRQATLYALMLSDPSTEISFHNERKTLWEIFDSVVEAFKQKIGVAKDHDIGVGVYGYLWDLSKNHDDKKSVIKVVEVCDEQQFCLLKSFAKALRAMVRIEDAYIELMRYS